MTVIFDLDYTLLDTTRFKHDLGKSLERCGVKSEKFWETYRASTKNDNRIRVFNLETLLGSLEGLLTCNPSTAESYIRTVLEDMDDYLFPDVIWLLKTLKEEGHIIKIFSHGTYAWQKMKIDYSSLGQFCDAIVITEGYKEEDMEVFQGDDNMIVMVNDNGIEITAIKKKWPEILMIGIPGPKGLPNDSSLPVGKTMKEVYSIIQGL